METYITKSMLAKFGSDYICGRPLRWNAPAYEANSPYGGLAIVNVAYPEDEHPLHCTTLEGDRLDYAFWDGDTLAYSDRLRYVTIDL